MHGESSVKDLLSDPITSCTTSLLWKLLLELRPLSMPRPLSLLSFLLLHATGLARPLTADSLTAPNGARPAAGAGSR